MGEKRHTIIFNRDPKLGIRESETRTQLGGTHKVIEVFNDRQTTVIPSPKVKSPFGKNRQLIVQSTEKNKVTPLIGTVDLTVQDKLKRPFVKDRR